MATTLSADVVIYRATKFDRHEFRKLGLTSGSDVNEEFGASIDLREAPLPIFPVTVNTPNITTIKFVVIQVTGGEAVIRLANTGTSYNSLDIPVRGTLILSGISLTQILVIERITPCYIEIFGAGKK